MDWAYALQFLGFPWDDQDTADLVPGSSTCILPHPVDLASGTISYGNALTGLIEGPTASSMRGFLF